MLQNFSYNVYSRYRVAKPFPFILVLGISAAIIHQVACFYTVKRSRFVIRLHVNMTYKE